MDHYERAQDAVDICLTLFIIVIIIIIDINI